MTTTFSLYELADLRERLVALVADEDGELTPDLEAAWDAIEGQFSEKVERTGLFVKELLAESEAIATEAKRLAERAKAREAKAERLKALLLTAMQKYGTDKVRGLLCTVATQANPPKVEAVTALDEAELRNVAMFAPAFVRHEECWSLDRKAVLDAHKRGELPEEIARRVKVTQTTGLRIR